MDDCSFLTVLPHSVQAYCIGRMPVSTSCCVADTPEFSLGTTGWACSPAMALKSDRSGSSLKRFILGLKKKPQTWSFFFCCRMPTTRCKETEWRENQTHQGTSNCQVRTLTSRKLLSKGHVHSRRDMKTPKMVDSMQKCHVQESESSECPTCRFRRCHAPPFFLCVWCVCVRV